MKTRTHQRKLPILLLALSSVFGGCDSYRSKDDRVVAYTSVDQVFSEPIFRYCEQEAGPAPKEGN